MSNPKSRRLPLGFIDMGHPPIDPDLAAIADAGEDEPEPMMWSCPDCMNDVFPEDKICPNCGFDATGGEE